MEEHDVARFTLERHRLEACGEGDDPVGIGTNLVAEAEVVDTAGAM